MGRQLDGLTRLFAALVPALAVGCGDEPIDESQFTDDLCDEAGFHMLQAVEPAMAVDSIELREAYAQMYDDNGEPVLSEASVLDADGEHCSGATDMMACLAALGEIPLSSDFSVPSYELEGYRSLVYTRADEVGGIGHLQALREFLGDIDAPGDAALFAYLSEHQLICEAGPDVGAHDDGWVLFTRTGGGCGEGDDVRHHVLLVRTDASIEVLDSELIERGDPDCSVGRMPAGLCRIRRATRAASPVGALMAEVAELEAASITAFAQLSRELVLHAAPRSLVRASMAARRDEIRHARVTAALARRWGGRPRAPAITPQAPRALVDIAIDNAIEGCIRETFGAASAHVMAKQAQDPTMRRVMARIAVDETRHAALSWSLAGWMDARLGVEQRREVARRRRDALERLEGELTIDHDASVHAVTGLPRGEQARSLYRGLARARLA
jgi:hypothetical protein